MRIPRLHWFELEDQAWFPRAIRDFSTDYIRFLGERFALHGPIVPLVSEALRATGATRIVDLCSGAGGPMRALLSALAKEGLKPGVTLTDLFPNAASLQEVVGDSNGQVACCSEPIDARNVPAALPGFRTMFNGFHHFKPGDATAILQNAADARQPIGIFEYSDRALAALLPMIFITPLMVLAVTPFVRPFRWSRLFWTYLVPLVPLTIWWDGTVSQLRAYSADELRAMAESFPSKDFEWRSGTTPIGSKGRLTYLLGIPRPAV